MPSPFPGMDPFLEEPAHWRDFHTNYLIALRNTLAREVQPDFEVRVEERIYVTDPITDRAFRLIVPDVILSRATAPPGGRSSHSVTITRPTRVEMIDDVEVHDRYLVILDKRSGSLVSAIELLSPANKVAGSEGRLAMEEKRRLMLQVGVNWIEIDLLRAGLRPESLAGESAYCATLSRTQLRRWEIWLFDLRDRLPVIAVPLGPEHEDAPLDLQAAFDKAYDEGLYASQTNYGADSPPPTLPAEEEAWVRERIAAWTAGG